MKLKESLAGHTSSHSVYPTGGDANIGHGYGTMNTKMVPKSMQNGWPYDPEQEIEEPNEWDYSLDPVERKKFNNKLGFGRVSLDPNVKYDMRAMADDQYNMENVLRKIIKLILEDAFRLRSRSSEPDYVTNQFGQKVNGGTQFGWSSAFPFDDEESREPVNTFKDIINKHNKREGIVDDD